MITLNLTEDELNIAQYLFVQLNLLPLAKIDLPVAESIHKKLLEAQRDADIQKDIGRSGYSSDNR